MKYYGLSEGYSIKCILNQINCDKIVLVNGDTEENHSLQRDLTDNKSLPPDLDGCYSGQLMESNIKAEIANFLTSSFNFKSSGREDLEYMQFKGILRFRQSSRHENLELTSILVNEDSVNQGMASSSSQEKPEYSLLKEFKLLKFKEILEKQEISSILECGRLNIGGRLFIVPDGGSLRLEGVFCPEYFKVRSLLYENFLH